MTPDNQTPDSAARAAAGELAELTGTDQHDVAIVLGSGWVPAADRLGKADRWGKADRLGKAASEVSVTDLPGFVAPAVAGHAGRIRSCTVGDRRLLIFLGRTHLYEGLGVASVVHGVRVAAAAGCSTIILTNAAGGLREDYTVGQPVLISDHLNLTGRSPIVGPTFVDLTDLYANRLRALARAIDPTLTEGLYAALPGPHYETPAEIRMLRTMGADLVGMSTAMEAIAARAAGISEVLGISLVTNLAAGITGEPLDHTEVLEAGRSAAVRMGDLLAEVVNRL